MADAMIGFGIGLSGTPKDYTSLVAARQRQKQIGELEEKKQKKSLLDPIMKSIAIDKNLYMDYRIPEVRDKTAEFVDKAKKAAESSDINALAMAQQEYNTYIQQMVAERKMFDEDLKNYEAGTALMVKDPRLLRQAKTLEEARKLAEDNPDDFFVSEYGTVSAKPIKPLNIQSFYQKAADDLRTGEAMPTQIIINGKPATVMVRPIDKQQFENRMRTDFRSNQGIQQTTRVNFTLEGGDLKGLSPTEKAKKLEDYYVQQGAVYLGRDPQNVFREGKGLSFSFNLGTGDKQPAINQPMATDNVQIGSRRGNIDVPVYGSTATGDIVSTFPTSKDLFYTDDNSKVQGGSVKKGTYNQVSVGIVANSDIKIPGDPSFLMDYNIPKAVKDYAGQTILAGQLVDPELKDYLAAQGKLRASIITFGKDEDDNGIYRSASLVQQNSWFKANKDKSPEIENLYNTQRQIERDLTQMYSKGKTASPAGPPAGTATPAKAPAAAPAPAGGKKAKKPNKYGI